MKIKSPLLATLTFLGIAFIFSCSNVENPELPPPGENNNTDTKWCVYFNPDECYEALYDECPYDGELQHSCPFSGNPSDPSNPSFSSNSSLNNKSSNSTTSGSSSSRATSSAGSTPSHTGGPVSYYGELKASGNKLIGSKTGSTAVQVRGVSLGWSNTGWGSDRFFNATTVNAMADSWKAEVIRVPIGYSESGGYQTDASNLTRVKAAINAAIAKDVYVIIDWHSHNAHSETSAATAFFTDMAQTYGGYDNVIFEVYNEPENTPWTTIRSYANTVISAIRQYSDNLILVGTRNWSQEVNEVTSNPVSDSKSNIAYVVHFYAYSHPYTGYTTSGNATFQSAINSVLNAGYPVFASEYGTTHSDGGQRSATGAIGNYNTHSASATDDWHTFMDSKKISSCAWNVNDKEEGSAFFGTGSTFDMSSWTNTSKMTSSGQYIYSKLTSYANSAPYRTGSNPGTTSSSSGGGSVLYCDYGPGSDGGEGGCWRIDDASECDRDWGIVATRCGRTDLLFCIYDPWEDYSGGCYQVSSSAQCTADYGEPVSRCPGFSYHRDD